MKDLCLLLLVIFYVRNASSEDQDPCHLVPHNKFINDPSACDSYFLCKDGKSVPSKCPSPYWFNKKTGGCDHKSNVECHDPVVTNPCENIGKKQFAKDPNDCSGYYICKDGKNQGHDTCKNGLHFDEKVQTCIYRESSKCKDAESSDDPVDFICINIPNGLNLRHENNCAQYWTCKDEKGTVNKCKDNEYFHQKIGKCDGTVNVTCEAIPSCYGVEENGIVKDPQSCAGWFRCVDGEAIKNECGDGLWFVDNGTSKKCDYKHNISEKDCPNRCEGVDGEWAPKPGTKCFTVYHCKDGKINGDAHDCPKGYRYDIELKHCVSEEKVDEITCKTKK